MLWFAFSEPPAAPQLLAPPLVNQTNTAAALYQTGQRLYYQGRYAEALSQQQQTLAIAQDIGDRDDEADALRELGIAYLELWQADKALQRHQDALSLYRDIGDRAGEATVLGGMGWMTCIWWCCPPAKPPWAAQMLKALRRLALASTSSMVELRR
ncbi:MAG: tetratricopeptide repeat protein [Pseudanabaenales cyanobacterium]|nr:tetratricopeptide repeat protein [Pseudanabaenales cyanobacterium]